MKCPERWCKKRACDIGETGSGWIIVSLKCPNCGRVIHPYRKGRERNNPGQYAAKEYEIGGTGNA